jgi:hypothetical protein
MDDLSKLLADAEHRGLIINHTGWLARAIFEKNPHLPVAIAWSLPYSYNHLDIYLMLYEKERWN